MEIKELRNKTGLSQAKFGKFYNIPLRTVQNWENNVNKCPGYVLQLLERAVMEDLKAGKFEKK